MPQNNNQNLIIRNSSVNGINQNPEKTSLNIVDIVGTSDTYLTSEQVINSFCDIIETTDVAFVHFPAASDITNKLFGDDPVVSGYSFDTLIQNNNINYTLNPGSGVNLIASSDNVVSDSLYCYKSIIKAVDEVDLYLISHIVD